MKFLNRLLTEDPKYKERFLTRTVFSLARISVGLHKSGSISILRGVVTDLKELCYPDDTLRILAECFDKFDEPEGIKEILKNGLTNMMPEVETQCLGLLQKHDPDFVKEWQSTKSRLLTHKSKESS